MKNEVIGKISVVINALNGITVCGKNNLANLSGSIAVLEELATLLNKLEITEPSNTAE